MEKLVKNFVVLGLPVLVCIFSTANTARNIKIEYWNITSNVNKNFGGLQAFLNPPSSEVPLKSITIEFQPAYEFKTFYVEFLVIVHEKGTSKKLPIISFRDINVCNVVKLARKNKRALHRQLYGNFENFTNVMNGCPFKKDVNYYLRNYIFDESIIPFYGPLGIFHANVTLRRVSQDGQQIRSGWISLYGTASKKSNDDVPKTVL